MKNLLLYKISFLITQSFTNNKKIAAFLSEKLCNVLYQVIQGMHQAAFTLSICLGFI